MNMKKSLGALVAAATLVTGFSATPAFAGRYDDDGYYSYRDRDNYRYHRRDRGYRCD